jgi:hypothetical protein
MRHNQQQAQSQSVQSPNANSSSVNDVLKLVANVFQPTVTEHNVAKSGEDRTLIITKIVLTFMKPN